MVLTSVRDTTRSGWASAAAWQTMPPMDTPSQWAAPTPAASSTASPSAAMSSSPYGAAASSTWVDRPVSRLSNCTTRHPAATSPEASSGGHQTTDAPPPETSSTAGPSAGPRDSYHSRTPPELA